MSVFYPQVTHQIGGNTAGATANVSSGTYVLAGGNNITLSQNGNSVTISGGAGGGDGLTAGISTQGNTAGTTGFVSGSYQLVATNNITLSQSVNAQSATITIVGPTLLSAGMSTGGNTSGDTGFVSNRLILAGGNNITLSGSTNAGSMTITISAGAGGAGLSAGMSTNGNTSGDTGAVTGRLILAGGNNITLSGSTNAGSMTITISGGAAGAVPTLSHWAVLPSPYGTQSANITHGSMRNATMWLFPLAQRDLFPGNMTVSTVLLNMFASHSNSTASTEAHTSTFSFGIYRLDNATRLTRVLSGSSTWGSNAGNNSISSLYTGLRWLSLHGSQLDATTLSQTSYWGAIWFRTSGTNINTASHGPVAVRYGHINQTHQGKFFAASSTANSYVRNLPFQGIYSASFTTGMPATVAMSDMIYTGSTWPSMVPDVRLLGAGAASLYGLTF